MGFTLQRFRYASYFRPPPKPTTPLTRREFYRIAQECSARAIELARYDQHRVRLDFCHDFNEWLYSLKAFTGLNPLIASITPARPIARWQILVAGGLIGILAFFFLFARMGQPWGSIFSYAYVIALLILFFLPERLYGSTVEMLEAKTLRIVESLESILLSGQMDFSEAAYFQVKDDLALARKELRQQIDLAHRRF